MKTTTRSARWTDASGRSRLFIEFMIPLLTAWVRLRFAVRVEGLQHIPRDGPVILAANHVSPHDPVVMVVLGVAAGRRTRAATLDSLFALPIIGWVLLRGGQIPIRRGAGPRSGLEAVEQALAEGDCVLVYPEGGIVAEGQEPRAKSGVGWLALGTGAPVVPVTSWGLRPGQSRARGLLGWLRLRSPAGVVISPPLRPLARAPDRAAAQDMADEVLDRIRAQLPTARALATRSRP